MTKLIKAAASGNLEAVKTCLAQGEDINQIDANGRTALMAASVTNDAKIVYHLSTIAGINVNASTNDHGYTALGWACYNHNPAKEHDFSQVINILLNAGADVNHKDDWGNFPLYSAVESNDAELVVRLLDQSDIDVHQRHSKNNLSALELANSKNLAEIADLFEQYSKKASFR